MEDRANPRQYALQAAERLACRDATALTADAVAQELQVSIEQLRPLLGDFDELLCELLAQLYDGLRDRVAKVTLNMPAGPARVKLVMETYLQAHLESRALQQLLNRMRTHPRGAALIRQRTHGFAVLLQVELNDIRWPRAAATARLLASGLAETAAAEAEAGHRLPDLREILLNYLDRAPAKP